MHEHMHETTDALGDLLVHAFGHSIQDTLVLVPFLFITYLAMEALEHGARGWSERVVARAGKAGPLLGALLGAVPQCGFSAMGATLFSGRVVTYGTLIAVFLSTSDEMLPVFIANKAPISMIAGILIFKVIVGMVAGFLVDFAVHVLRVPMDNKLRISELCRQDHCDCGIEEADACPTCNGCSAQALAEAVYEDDGGTRDTMATLEGCDCCDCDHTHALGHAQADEKHTHEQVDEADSHAAAHEGEGHEHEYEHGHDHADHDHAGDHEHKHVHSIVRSALRHTVQVTVFVFIITLALELLLLFVGTDDLATLMGGNTPVAVFLSALFGLIPNCAASIAISELYIEGALGAGAMISGLLVGAGVGLLVLFRANRPMSQNVAAVAILYVAGVICGLAVTLSGVTF